MAHLTAGDITPIGQIEEVTYGTTPATPTYVYREDIREGGNITPTDNPNPYLNWRYQSNGSRYFDDGDYVSQQKDAGYSDAIECRDAAGWSDILKYAGLGTSNNPPAVIPSRSVQFGFKQDANATQYALSYKGCKTDQLKISADVPAGIAKFDEVVMASYRDESATTFATTPSSSNVPAVQWVSGITLNGTQMYPQSFAITIKNNLGRVQKYDTALGKTISSALVEGRQEVEMEMTLWMEDFTELVRNMDNYGTYRTVSLTLGSTEAVTLIGMTRMMADGTNHGLVQDKQLQTLRLRLFNLYYSIAA